MPAGRQLAFLAAFLAAPVAAEDGDDFSNNLFSDLAPLLTLFGERVTMQFMSQSMGWADNIVLAMAPLGVITTIVSAIRVGGPSWLKALVGRAMENLAAAEAELMSSTSNEVCELWNGRQVVRCMGSAPVVEFLCLLPVGWLEKVPRTQPKITAIGFEEAVVKYLATINLNMREDFNRWRVQRDPSERQLPTKDQEQEPDDLSEMVIIGKKVDVTAAAPNISLNAHSSFWRGELRAIAVVGTILQLGVLAYSGFATYHPSLKFKKDDRPIPNYAYPCTAVGTLVLVAGLLLCAHVVESSTIEKRYQATGGRAARLVWLQQAKTVNDQAFDSFAIFAEGDRAVITTSRRPEAPDRDTLLALKTVVGTAVSLGGFVLQFSGLRGMHWSATIVQLGAVLVMTAFRAWVRRGLATPPRCQPLSSQFELDWFATTLGDIANAPWVTTPKSTNRDPSASDSENGVIKGWTIVTGVSPETYQGLREMGKRQGSEPSEMPEGRDHETIETAEGRGYGGIGDSKAVHDNEEAVYDNEETISDKDADDNLEAHTVLELRRDLGRLAHWRGPASGEAMALTAAIEIAMNTLFSTSEAKELTWSVRVRYAGLDTQQVHFRLERRGETWKAPVGEVDAALSLWLYSVDGHELDGSKQDQSKQGVQQQRRQRPIDEDKWLRQEGQREKRSLRLLGPASRALHRDLLWWIPHDLATVIKVEEVEGNEEEGGEEAGDRLELQNHRIVGSGPPSRERCRDLNGRTRYRSWASPTRFQHEKKKRPLALMMKYRNACHWADDFADALGVDKEAGNTVLATESNDALKLLYAQDMFSAFMWSMAKTMAPMEDNAEIRLDDTRDLHGMHFFTLWNEKLAKMAQDIQTVGLGSLDQIYLSIIPPLSAQQKLPRAEAVIDLVRRQARPHEQVSWWVEAGESYLWLLRTAKYFPQSSSFATRAIAVFMEYLRTVSLDLELREAQREEDDKTRHLWNLKELLERELLQPVRRGILSGLMRLYEIRERGWRCVPVQKARCGWVENTDWAKTFGFMTMYAAQNIDTLSVGAKDIHNWTWLHEAARTSRERAVKQLIQRGWDVNAQDLSEYTPLHYACRRTEGRAAQVLIQSGAEVDARGRDGITPLHIAAMNGHLALVRTLIESGATVDALDRSRNTPLLWAAYNGHADAVEELWENANRKLRNDSGRTALHLAAIAGREAVLRLLNKLGADIEVKDGSGRTPLHYAARNGFRDVVRLLVAELDADINASDNYKETPLHLAIEGGYDKYGNEADRHVATVRLLLECNADKEARNGDRRTPLGYAVRMGYDAMVRLLVAYGADVGTKGNTGRATLYEAISGRHMAIAELLVEHGTDIEGRGFGGMTPLHAAITEESGAMVKLLVEHGADVGARDDEGKTPLHFAADAGHESILKLLIGHGADVGARANGGETPLHFAADAGHESILKLLIEHGADVGARDDEGKTPLDFAAYAGYESTSKLLIEHGADVGARDNKGKTPLHSAAYFARESILKLLIEHGADAGARDDEGKTPLHHAREWSDPAAIRLLVEHGADVEARDKDGMTPEDYAVEIDGEEPGFIARLLRRSLTSASSTAS